MKQAQDRKWYTASALTCVEKRGEEKVGMSVFEKQTSQGLLQVFKVHVLMSRKDVQNPGVWAAQLRGRAPSSALK